MIIMHIHFSQVSLKLQFPLVDGLRYTTLQYSQSETQIRHGLQIVHCRGNHWILASNIGCDEDSLNIYDSVYSSVDATTQAVLHNLFYFSDLHVVKFQKQCGGADCGLYAIAAATSVLHKQDPSGVIYNQDKMRNHLIECIESGVFKPYPV